MFLRFISEKPLPKFSVMSFESLVINPSPYSRQLIFLLRLYRAYSASFAPLLRHNKLDLNSTFWVSTDFNSIFSFFTGIIFSTVLLRNPSIPRVLQKDCLKL